MASPSRGQKAPSAIRCIKTQSSSGAKEIRTERQKAPSAIRCIKTGRERLSAQILGQKAPSVIRCIRTDGCWFGSSRRSANSSAKTRPPETNRQQLAYRPVVKPGPPLSVVLDGLVKPRPPLLRVNRRILVFFFRRGWSGFHAAPEKVWLRDHELLLVWGVVPAVFSGLVFLLRCRCC